MSSTQTQPDARPRRDAIVPRILRAMAAPAYVGMCRAQFNETVRPHLREIPIGKQGIGFDRLEIDAFIDAYMNQHAIDKGPAGEDDVARSGRQGGKKWREKPSQVSTKGMASGTSTDRKS